MTHHFAKERKNTFSCIYLYGCKLGPNPGHIFQGKAINALFRHYLSLSPFKTYNLILSEGFRPLLAGSLMKRMNLAEKHVNILFGDFIPSIAKKRFSKDIVDLMISDGADGFIANSTLTAELFKKTFGDKYLHKIRVCWPTLNPSFLRSASHNPLEKNVSDTNIGICSFLYLSYLDGADLLPEIFQLILNEVGTKVKMYVISSHYDDEYKKLLLKKANNLPNFNVILGYQPYNTIRTIFRKCLVFLYPARLKLFGLPVIEAMSEGLIPIVTKTTGAKDFVKKVDPKLVVSIDPNTIAHRILEIFSKGLDEIRHLSLTSKDTVLKWAKHEAKKRFIEILRYDFDIKI